MAKNKRKKYNAAYRDYRKINIWAMVRDIMIAAMNKGQLPLTGVILIVIIIVAKLESKEASKLLFEIIDLLVKAKILGYFLFAVTLFLWFIHAKLQRRTFTNEIKRLSNERTKLQKTLIPEYLESSKK